jgi:hypothetical protein
VATDIGDSLGVEVERQQAGETLIQELHWKSLDGQWTWFTDCTPL